MTQLGLSLSQDALQGFAAIAGRDSLGRTVVWLRGEHDASTALALSKTVARAIQRNSSDLVLDLSGVQFMDSATAGVIGDSLAALHRRSRSLTLRAPSPGAQRFLNLGSLGELVEDRPRVCVLAP